jgi:ABC-type sulfate transport system permease component
MDARVYNQVQLAFWDVIIFALSRSKLIRRIAQWIYQLISSEEWHDSIKTSLIISLAGLCFGMVLFLLASWLG